MYNNKPIIKFLKQAQTLQDLKTLYKNLSKKLHPDMGGNLADMQALNSEYDYLKGILHNATGTKQAEKETTTSMEAFKDIINKLIKHSNITIDIIGSWLWISGRGTFVIKDNILYGELKCKYSKSNKKFYWFNGIDKQGEYKPKGGFLKQAITRYGINRIESEESKVLA